MAHRERHAYIGAFHDTNFGIDDECEVFRTIADAMAALTARHRSDGWQELPVRRTDGSHHEVLFPQLTNDAYILLWRIDPEDQMTTGELRYVADKDHPLDPKDYVAGEADKVVWVGARGAIREGSLAEFNAQRAERNRQDVREAGSVVVTDA